MERELTRDEKIFFIERAITAQARAAIIEQTRDFINAEYRADDPEGMGIDIQEFIEEILEGTGWELRGDIDRTDD